MDVKQRLEVTAGTVKLVCRSMATQLKNPLTQLRLDFEAFFFHLLLVATSLQADVSAF